MEFWFKGMDCGLIPRNLRGLSEKVVGFGFTVELFFLRKLSELGPRVLDQVVHGVRGLGVYHFDWDFMVTT
jgi:hypothetical protein